MRTSGPTYSDRALAHTYTASRKLDVHHYLEDSGRTIDSVHFWGTILPNAMPVNGGSIVFQVIRDRNFYRN